ncbi:MAG: hypothetical protein SVR94_16945 [Pseudomonadota bacterium]|nr:hypothetical protein [Pseudomonadota bacterium]
MLDKIQPQPAGELSRRTLLLKLIAHRFSLLDNDPNFGSDNDRFYSTGQTALEYLKTTGQYRRQFELCLKNFDGHTADSFNENYITALRKLYQNHVMKLGKSLILFSQRHINLKKYLTVDFKDFEIDSTFFETLIRGLSNQYGQDVLHLEYQPWNCQLVRIHESSLNTIERIEGKLRVIGQFACLGEVISFLKIRIGLFGHYTHKILVDDLDELINHLLIESNTGNINPIQKKKAIDELVKVAALKYEVLDNPIYLINSQTYKAAIRHRIKSFMNRN